MLPDFSKLSLCSTDEFFALTEAEAVGRIDPVSMDQLLFGAGRGSSKATFRVRSQFPAQNTGEYTYTYFEAEPLWDWVKEYGKTNPLTKEPIWKEDWLALHDRYAPDEELPPWVRSLPQLDPNWVDNRTYAYIPQGTTPGNSFHTLVSHHAHVIMDTMELYVTSPNPVAASNFYQALLVWVNSFRNTDVRQAFMSMTRPSSSRLLYELFRVFCDTNTTWPSGLGRSDVGRIKGAILLISSMLLIRAPFRREMRNIGLPVYSAINNYLNQLDAITDAMREANMINVDSWRGDVFHAARQLRHHLVWDRRIGDELLYARTIDPNLRAYPASDQGTARAAAGRAPHQVLAQRQYESGVLSLMQDVHGIETFLRGFLESGPQLFFGNSDHDKCIDLFNQVAAMFLTLARASSNDPYPVRLLDGRVQTAALTIFQKGLDLWDGLVTMPGMANYQDQFERLARAAATAMAAGVVASVDNHSTTLSVQLGGTPSLETIENYFWLYVAHTYHYTVRVEEGSVCTENALFREHSSVLGLMDYYRSLGMQEA